MSKNFRKQLKKEGKNICNGILCKGVVKNLKEFVKNSNICKKCNTETTKQYHLKNGRSYIKTKNKLKQEGSCSNCGETNIIFLEFDHFKGEKLKNICHLFGSKSILKEAEKTQFLCIWCHRIKSYNESKRSDYTDYMKDPGLEKSDDTILCNGKLCNGKYRNIENFYIRKDTNKHRSICKKCQLYNDFLRRLKRKQYVIDEKLRIGKCFHCDKTVDNTNYMCFDFDHLHSKFKNVSLLSKINSSLETIKTEIEKCQLLCCYCHKLKTTKDRNYNYTLN